MWQLVTDIAGICIIVVGSNSGRVRPACHRLTPRALAASRCALEGSLGAERRAGGSLRLPEGGSSGCRLELIPGCRGSESRDGSSGSGAGWPELATSQTICGGDMAESWCRGGDVRGPGLWQTRCRSGEGAGSLAGGSGGAQTAAIHTSDAAREAWSQLSELVGAVVVDRGRTGLRAGAARACSSSGEQFMSADGDSESDDEATSRQLHGHGVQAEPTRAGGARGQGEGLALLSLIIQKGSWLWRGVWRHAQRSSNSAWSTYLKLTGLHVGNQRYLRSRSYFSFGISCPALHSTYLLYGSTRYLYWQTAAKTAW